MDTATGYIISSLILTLVPSGVSIVKGLFERSASIRLEHKMNALQTQSQSTHALVDGGMHRLLAAKDELTASEVAGAHAEGKLEGRAEAKADAIVDQAAAIVADAGKKT
jgi:hypothetical protein